jgi:hypothetical protein
MQMSYRTITQTIANSENIQIKTNNPKSHTPNKIKKNERKKK